MALGRRTRGRQARVTPADEPGGTGEDVTQDFVDEVTWYMREHKMTRADLAGAMGVSPGRVSQILSGEENLTLRTLSAVISALGARLEITLHPAEGH